MKSKVIFAASILTLTTSLSAQNFGGKFGEKMNAKIQGTDGPNKKELEEAAKDSSSTFLDSKELKKDAQGIGGIYYSTIPITAQTMGNNPMTNAPFEKQIKKFLVNYDETKYSVTLNTQHSYETSNDTKWVKAALWTSTTGSVEENFSGQPIKDFSNGPTNNIDCKRAYEYKK
jgi:hypothetical protein